MIIHILVKNTPLGSGVLRRFIFYAFFPVPLQTVHFPLLVPENVPLSPSLTAQTLHPAPPQYEHTPEPLQVLHGSLNT